MNRGSLARSLVLWWILFVGCAPKKSSAAATPIEGASDIANFKKATERNEWPDPRRSGGSSNNDGRRRILSRASEEFGDHCITSADCAFNGECSKKTTEGYDRNSHGSSNSKTEKQKTIDPETPGRCDCFAGWTGRTCEVLDLLPVDPQKVGLVLPNHDSSTWGGSVVYHEADGLYHMFASEILYNCGLYSWTTNSQVIRAVSESPFGPYKKVQVILPPFAHDANVIRAPTGEFVLFVTALKGVKPKDCREPFRNQTFTDRSTTQRRKRQRRYLRNRNALVEKNSSTTSNNNEKDDIPPKDTYMLWAPQPEGPWSEPVMVLNSTIYNSDYWKKHNKTAKCDSNLNGIILPGKASDNDETSHHQQFFGLWRRCETEDLLTIPHALVASDWRNASTYQPIIDHPLFVLAGSGAEDPSNIWTTRTSDMKKDQVAYHAIFHDEQATRCMLGSCGGQGRHAVSLDGTTWRYSSVNAYERYFSWGTSSLSSSSSNRTTYSLTTTTNTNENSWGVLERTVRADTRARPHIVLAAEKSGDPLQQIPIALSTGLKETDESGYVYTLVQPLGR